jgi:hypothetical protein
MLHSYGGRRRALNYARCYVERFICDLLFSPTDPRSTIEESIYSLHEIKSLLFRTDPRSFQIF